MLDTTNLGQRRLFSSLRSVTKTNYVADLSLFSIGMHLGLIKRLSEVVKTWRKYEKIVFMPKLIQMWSLIKSNFRHPSLRNDNFLTKCCLFNAKVHVCWTLFAFKTNVLLVLNHFHLKTAIRNKFNGFSKCLTPKIESRVDAFWHCAQWRKQVALQMYTFVFNRHAYRTHK